MQTTHQQYNAERQIGICKEVQKPETKFYGRKFYELIRPKLITTKVKEWPMLRKKASALFQRLQAHL